MEGVQQVHEEVKPVMYRWISTSRPSANAKSGEKTMSISFSVPIIVDISPLENSASFKARRTPAKCAVKGCAGTVKYKLVRDSSLGACGMAHLNCLEA
jgi:Ino eighty subunit 2